MTDREADGHTDRQYAEDILFKNLGDCQIDTS